MADNSRFVDSNFPPIVNEILMDPRTVVLKPPRDRSKDAISISAEYIAKFPIGFQMLVAFMPQATETPVYLSVVWGGYGLYCDESSAELAVMQEGNIIADDVQGYVRIMKEVEHYYLPYVTSVT